MVANHCIQYMNSQSPRMKTVTSSVQSGNDRTIAEGVEAAVSDYRGPPREVGVGALQWDGCRRR